MRRVATTALVGLVGLTLLTAGCDSEGDQGDQELIVFAAASLTEPFRVLASRFEEDNPGVEVTFSFDSSSTLAAQVIAGAPADVVATADLEPMRILEEDGQLSEAPVIFARNEIALVVPPDNPAGIDDITDLEDVDYVICARAAPCGALALDALAEAGVTEPPTSLEVDVKAVLNKVVLDEADAGIVYASDVVAAGDSVVQVPLEERYQEQADDPIAVVARSSRQELAGEFIDLVLSPEGQEVLGEAGFESPSSSSGQ
jgi:molybdate transport system substrate-binding protein